MSLAFKLYRQDRTSSGGGLMAYFRDDIPHRPLPDATFISRGVECMGFEVMWKNVKCFIVCIYNPPRTKECDFRHVFSQLCEKYVHDGYINIFIGDMNYDMKKSNVVHELCDIYGMKNLIKDPTCFKSDNPS